MIPKLYLAGGIAAIILVLSGYAWFEHNRYARVKAEYDGFVAQAQAIAAVQLAENQRKEKENVAKIHAAESNRATAIEQLRLYQKRANRSSVSGSTTTTGSDKAVCWTTERFDTAFRELEGIIIEGQTSVINSRALLEAWPQ